jgi:predicted histone-like DNA-binding protein
MKIKLEEKRSPAQPNGPARWHAVPVQGEKVTTEEVACEISERSSLTSADTEGVLESLASLIPRHLLRGEPVYLRGVGTFRIGLHSSGVDSPADFNRSCIRGHRVIYTPDARILNALGNMDYEDTGIRGADSLRITWIADMLSGTANRTLTPGGTVKLSGERMRIEGADPAVGLKLLHVETQTLHGVALTSVPVNKAREVIFAVPFGLPDGHWQIRIVTQFSGTAVPQSGGSRIKRLICFIDFTVQ